MKLSLLALLALCACAELPPIEGGVCGNGLLDPGEDCDTPDARCVQCGWTCDVAADCLALPAPRDGTLYGCGVDHVCHAAGGQLGAQTADVPFAAQTIYATDLDRDGIADVVGLAPASLVSRLGDPRAELSAEHPLLTPTCSPELAAIMDFDSDGTTDVLLPTRDGIAAFASPHGTLSPFAFALELQDIHVDAKAGIPIDGKRVFILANDIDGTTDLVGSIIDLTDPFKLPYVIPLCDVHYVSTTLEIDSIDFYDTTPDPNHPSVGVTFIATSKTTGQRTLCAVRIIETMTPTRSYDSGAAPAYPAPMRRPVLADLDGSGCPSIVLSDHGPAQLQDYPGYRDSAGKCNVAPLTSMPPIPAPSTDAVVGRVRLVPPAGPAPDALVLSSGIWTGAPPYTRLYTADRPIRQAAFGDINADGNVDAVVIGDDETVDVLYRTASPASFLRTRLATSAVPTRLIVGDFDGNDADDVAYIEPHAADQALMIAYGTLDRPLPATMVGSYENVLGLVRLGFEDSADPFDLIDDIGLGDLRPRLVFSGFHGLPDRAMIPYLNPEGGGSPTATFTAVTGGHFVDGSPNVDFITLEQQPGRPPTLWLMAGAEPGGVYVNVFGLPPSKSGSADMPELAAFSPSKFLAWPTGGTDLAIAIDPVHAMAAVFDPSTLSSNTAPPVATSPLPGLTTGARLRAAFPVDVDGDGAPELLLAFALVGNPSGIVLACNVSLAGFDCRDLVAQIDGLLAKRCADAAPARFAAPGSPPDLVVQCGSGLYRVFHDDSGMHAVPLFSLDVPANRIDGVRFADVNGDAVDDLVVLARDLDNASRLLVFPQLTSREVPP